MGGYFWDFKNIWKLATVMVAHICEYIKAIALYTLSVRYLNYIPIKLLKKNKQAVWYK